MCHLPFGIGPRSCLGGKFAFMEAKMTMISILKQYQFVQAKDTKVSKCYVANSYISVTIGSVTTILSSL